MRAKSRTLSVGAALAMLLTLAAGQLSAADTQKPASTEEMMKAMAESAQPGTEHAKLEPLVGNWTYTGKFWMDPSKPPMESQGTIERKWILGGRFLEEKVSGTNFDGSPGFEGRGLWGYDNAQKKFTSNWVCSMGTGTCDGLGTSDSSGSTFTFHTKSFCPVKKEPITGREEIRFESNDKVVIESYMTEDGKEQRVMELVTTRK